MRESIYGPENRVVSAKLGGALYVDVTSYLYSDPRYPVYRFRFPEATGSTKTYTPDLVGKNTALFIQDSLYGSSGQSVGGGARINTCVYGSVSASIFYSDREVFVEGVAVFSPRTDITVEGLSISAKSFRAILGVSGVQTEGEGDDRVEFFYVYYFLNDRKPTVGTNTTGAYSGFMTAVVAPAADTVRRRFTVLCCDRYDKTGAGWVLNPDKSAVCPTPDPVFTNGTPLAGRSAVVSATRLSFYGEAGVAVVTVRSVAARQAYAVSPERIALSAHLGASDFMHNMAHTVYCPRHYVNAYQAYYAYSAGSLPHAFDIIFGKYVLYGNGMLTYQGTPGTESTWWQEERNYILSVQGKEANFAADTEKIVFSVHQEGGPAIGNQNIYSTGTGRLLTTFTNTIYVPGT